MEREQKKGLGVRISAALHQEIEHIRYQRSLKAGRRVSERELIEESLNDLVRRERKGRVPKPRE